MRRETYLNERRVIIRIEPLRLGRSTWKKNRTILTTINTGMLTATLINTGMVMPGTLTSTGTNTNMPTDTSTNTEEDTKVIPTTVSTENTIMSTPVMKSFRVNTFTSIRNHCTPNSPSTQGSRRRQGLPHREKVRASEYARSCITAPVKILPLRRRVGVVRRATHG
jgi:hypothetical protein